MTIKTKQIEQTLLQIIDPVTGKDIVSAGMVKGLQVSDNNDVVFLISIDPKMVGDMEDMRKDAENAVREIKDVGQVSVILTAEKKAPKKPSAPDPHGMNKNPPLTLPFKRIVAVASGKGGVGKSTIAANLAVALAKKGEKVGLLDADIYGPSIPNLMGIEGQKPYLDDARKLIPIMAHGVGVMSIGLMVEQDAPMIWRGPIVQSALYQLLRDVDWNGFDTLIIDMPPGTGDVQLTLAQKVDVTGAIIVSTSQDLALLDARKAIEMFKKTNVPVLGIVENMSVHVCTECGHEDHVFGEGRVKTEADLRNIPFLVSIPLSHETRDGLNDICQSLLSNILS